MVLFQKKLIVFYVLTHQFNVLLLVCRTTSRGASSVSVRFSVSRELVERKRGAHHVLDAFPALLVWTSDAEELELGHGAGETRLEFPERFARETKGTLAALLFEVLLGGFRLAAGGRGSRRLGGRLAAVSLRFVRRGVEGTEFLEPVVNVRLFAEHG